MKKKTILAALACGLLLNTFSARGDTLWWMVNDDATVDDNSIYSFVSSYGTWTDTDTDTGETYSGYNVGARVKVTLGDGSTKVLPIVYPDFSGETFDFVEFYDGGGNNASGFGT